MPQIITYNLPPYVELVDNPHFNGYVNQLPDDVNYNLDYDRTKKFLSLNLQPGTNNSSYAPYKLQSLGNYPLGMYTISVPNNLIYSGTFEAVDSTNTSISLNYTNNITETYPQKVKDEYMDVNIYSFAYKKYPMSPNPGGTIPFEKFYDRLVYDYDARPWQNTTSFIRHHVVETIYFRKQYNNSFIYGHCVAHLPDLPYNTRNAISDPTNLKLIPYSERTAMVGRYFILIKKMLNSNVIDCTFHPSLPQGKNLEVWIEPIAGGAHNINGVPSGEGAKVNMIYDGFFRSETGTGSSIVLPFIKNKSEDTQPALITMPEGSNYGAFRFYSGAKRSKDFDLYRNLTIPAAGTVINKAIPCNFSSY
jgi:hypothetical protein